MFTNINVLQGSAATYVKCGKIFNKYFAATLLINFPVKKFEKRLGFDTTMATTLWSRFLTHPVYQINIILSFRQIVRKQRIRGILSIRK